MQDNKNLIVGLIALLGIAFIGYCHFFLSPMHILVIVLGIIVFSLTFIKVEAGLFILVVSMLLSPEVVVGRTAVREITLRLEDFLIIVIFFGWFAKVALTKSYRMLVKTPLNLPIGLFVLICIISSLKGILVGSVKPLPSSFYILKTAEFFMIYFLVVNNVKTRAQVKKLLALFLMVSVLVAIYGIVQIGTIDRISAPFETGGTEPNTMGGYFVLIMAVALALLLYAPSPKQRFLMGGLFVLIFITFLYTLSRSSYMAFLVMLPTVILFSPHKRLLILLPLFLVLSPLVLPQKVLDRVNQTFQKDSKGGPVYVGTLQLPIEVDSSTLERISVWKKAKYNFLQRPFLGAGITALDVIDSQYARLIVEVGAAGFVLFLWLQIRIFRTGLNTFQNTDDKLFKAISLGLLGGLIAMLIQSWGAITFLIVRIMEPFWFLTGLMVVCNKIVLEGQKCTIFQKRREISS